MSKLGRYSKVYRRMWVDEKVKKLSQPPPCGFTLFQRLLTGPELTNIPGLFPAWEGGLASALHWSIEDFREAFEEIKWQGLAEADWDAGLVWVPNAIDHNEPESINVVIAWGETIKELPDCELKLKAFARLEAWAKAKGKAWEDAWAKACPMPSPMACPMGDRGPSPIQEQDTRSRSCTENSIQRPDRLEPPESAEMPAAPREKPKHVARFERSIREPRESDGRAIALFEAYREESGMSGVTYDAKARELFEHLVDESVTVEDVRLIVRGAKFDEWATGKAKMAASALLGSSGQRQRFTALARDPPRPKAVKAPRQPNGGEFGEAFLAAGRANR